MDLSDVQPFTPDRFQLEAMEAIDRDESVLVAAPTGAGKTLIAEHALRRAIDAGQKAFYTTPIKALSNQKFRDLVSVYGADNVGLLTGDRAVNGEAPVVVMTTEVLRNMLYARSNRLDDLAWVILDEVHYLRDRHRGPVWEEVIIHSPRSVNMVALSATVSNIDQLADWFRAVRGPTTLVVETKRPVELTHFELVALAGAKRDVMLKILRKGEPNHKGFQYDKGAGSANQGTKPRTPSRPHVVSRLAADGSLPAIYFLFSRNGCDDAAFAVVKANLDLTSRGQREQIDVIIERHVEPIGHEELRVLDFDRFRRNLRSGVAAHHAGMVPAFKEAVEECFLAGLLQVVFATETLALGINMPARTVVIEKLRKFNGDTHETLTPIEYTQLTGRAGRRGLDTVGTAVVLWSPWIDFEELSDLVGSRNFELLSAFRPSYNMVVNLMANHSPDAARELLGQSFAQFQKRGQRLDSEFDTLGTILHERGMLKDWKLTEKGKLLRQIHHEKDLILVEAIDSGIFDGLDAPALAAVVSCLSFESRSDETALDQYLPTQDLRIAVDRLHDLADDVIGTERRAGQIISRQPDEGFAEPAYRWAAGRDLAGSIPTDITGGDFVRSTKRLVDVLRQVGEATTNPVTANVARRAADAIDRGVVAADGATMDGLGHSVGAAGDS